MSSNALQEKKAYFQEQEIQSDDEERLPDDSFSVIGGALAEVKAMPPPRFPRTSGSFLGPTMKERQREWASNAAAEPSTERTKHPTLKRASTAPDSGISNISPASTHKRRKMPLSTHDTRQQPKRTISMSGLDIHPTTSSSTRTGVVPRELKNGKNVKLAENIRLEPEDKQIFRGKVVYMYPNDDISMARRHRIHKLIQLGATWVNTWGADITHIIVDEGEYTYSQLLRHFNIAGLPRHMILLKFDPYVPQCIEFGKLLDPTASRFLVKGSPRSSTNQPESSTSNSTPVLLPSSVPSESLNLPAANDVAHKNDLASSKRKHVNTAHEQKIHDPNEEVVKDSFADDDLMNTAQLYGDELSAAIEETKAVAHLPLEEHDDSCRPPNSSSKSYDSDPGEELEPSTNGSGFSEVTLPSSTGAGSWKGKFNQSAFSCMEPAGRKTSHNPNARTIEILEQMGKYYDQMQDHWRTNAYRQAVTTLRKQDIKISTSEQAAALPRIGSRIADKIEEIVLTDRLRRLDSTRNDPTDQVLRLFLGIYGVGLAQANKWIQAGHRTLDDIVAKAKLTESQKIGIQHYDDFAQRIPRAEVEAHGEIVEKALKKLDPAFQMMIMGSFRRGAKDSGDVDIIITKPGASVSEIRQIVFGTLVPALTDSGFLKCKLAASFLGDDGTKWHGVSCLPTATTWRRLDLLLVPEIEMGAALIYFTGNDIFNRSIRLLASKKGMRLNQRGLYKDVVRGKNREKLNEGTLVEGRSERKIFEILGVPWREPTERIC